MEESLERAGQTRNRDYVRSPGRENDASSRGCLFIAIAISSKSPGINEEASPRSTSRTIYSFFVSNRYKFRLIDNRKLNIFKGRNENEKGVKRLHVDVTADLLPIRFLCNFSLRSFRYVLLKNFFFFSEK